MHTEIWTRGPQQALALGRYVALLVSLHGTGLLGNQTSYGGPRGQKEFLESQRLFQRELIESLAADPEFAPCATEPIVERNRAIVRVTDALSLYAILGLDKVREIPDVPAAKGLTTLRMEPLDRESLSIRIDPWPFAGAQITLVLEGRRLPPRFASELEMRNGLLKAPWVTLLIEFLPA
jgi:hypothetical protein